MKLDHIAIWVKNLEAMKRFYTHFFDAKAGERYHNANKNFTSYFISFGEGARIELMHNPDISSTIENIGQQLGLAHFALSVGSREKVRSMTESALANGGQVLGEPRVTGDGYFESVIADPEGNRIELTE